MQLLPDGALTQAERTDIFRYSSERYELRLTSRATRLSEFISLVDEFSLV